jgi:hypothetical protein
VNRVDKFQVPVQRSGSSGNILVRIGEKTGFNLVGVLHL